MWSAELPPEINHNKPACVFLLLDQSESMSGEMAGSIERQSKAEGLADAVNSLLATIRDNCARGEGERGQFVRDYFDIGILGYGRSDPPTVRSPLKEPLSTQDLNPISLVAQHRTVVQRQEQVPSHGKLVERLSNFSKWIDPISEHGTPMCEALSRAIEILQPWTKAHVDSYPPIVIHITDGEATDGPADEDAREKLLIELSDGVKALATNHGGAFLYTCHLSSDRQASVQFPSSEERLPRGNKYASLLFRMSSVLAPELAAAAAKDHLNVEALSKGFVFNARLDDLIRFLDIGTRVITPAELH